MEFAVNIPEQEPQVGQAGVPPDYSARRTLSDPPLNHRIHQVKLDDFI